MPKVAWPYVCNVTQHRWSKTLDWVLGALPALAEDDPPRAQLAQGVEERLLAQTDAPVEHPPVAGRDPVEHLGEADGVALPLEPEGAPDDVLLRWERI